jgi:hypothetical protein
VTTDIVSRAVEQLKSVSERHLRQMGPKLRQAKSLLPELIALMEAADGDDCVCYSVTREECPLHMRLDALALVILGETEQ